jgi:cell division protein FtsB
MLLAIKANREYKITEDEKQKYINMGYKIAKLEEDKLIYEKVETKEDKKIVELEKENEKLKKEIEELKKDDKKKAKKGEGK